MSGCKSHENPILETGQITRFASTSAGGISHRPREVGDGRLAVRHWHGSGQITSHTFLWAGMRQYELIPDRGAIHTDSGVTTAEVLDTEAFQRIGA